MFIYIYICESLYGINLGLVAGVGEFRGTEMEVVIPIHHSMDFDFNSARSSPRRHIISAPSTPKRFGEEYYFSAPASPTRISQFYRDFEEFYSMIYEADGINGYDDQKEGSGSGATVPFDWEEKPGKPKVKPPIVIGGSNDNDGGGGGFDYDFAFEVSEDFETASVSAEDLFDGGVIKPLKPPPRLQLPDAVKAKTSPARQHHKKESAATDTGTTSSAVQKSTSRRRTTEERERGRVRAPAGAGGASSSSSRRTTRSLSPLRVSDEYPPWEEEDHQQQSNKQQSPKPSVTNNFSRNSSALSTNSKNLKKWSFKDFFLFRSASEGRAADKDPFRKYTAFRRYEEARISSGRAIESPGGSTGGSISRRRGPPVSAHELHYTINRAVSEDMKKKTFLPYKQGILGRLAFNPTVHALANGFGFSRN